MADSQSNDLSELETLVEGEASKNSKPVRQKNKPQSQASGEVLEQDSQEKKLADAQAMIEKLLAEKEELLSMEAGRRVSSGDSAYLGEHGGYLFEVGPKDKVKYEGLPTVMVRAVDESEAKRYYSNSRDWPIGTGIAIDTLQIPLNVVIKDNRRNAVIILHKRLSVIRSKLEKGQALLPQEQELLEKYEAEVHQF